MNHGPVRRDRPPAVPGPAGWRRYDLLGTAFSIGTDSEDVARALDRLLASFSRTDGANGPGGLSFSVSSDGHTGAYELHGSGRLLVRTPSWPAAASCLLQELNREALARFAGFAVHAGVVANGEGAIAFPASSGGGKSTMVAACLGAGFDYVSDEALCVGFDVPNVIPYAKPIQLSATSRSVLGLRTAEGDGERESEGDGDSSDGESSLTPADLGAGTAAVPLELVHVVRLERRAGPALLASVPPAQTCAWLLRFSFNHHKRPHASFELAADLARRSAAWHLQYEDAPRAASLLAERFGAGAEGAGERRG